jgi:hypothetical protein
VKYRLRAAMVIALLVAACDTHPHTQSQVTSPSGSTTSSSATTAAPTAPPTTTPSLPSGLAWNQDFPDPYIVVFDGVYYGFATESGLLHIQGLHGASSMRLVGLHDVLPLLPSWAEPFSSWAPAVLLRDHRFVLYYTALVAGTDLHCIGVALASRPEGPYRDTSAKPFLCPHEQGGAIDPSPFLNNDGTPFLLWKNDGVTLRQESAIWSQPLRSDGLALTGTPARLIGTDQAWEFPHVEAPSMTRIGDAYWLAYSANWWNQPAYGVGLAKCATPHGPCDKPFDRAVLRSRPGAEGPGGLEFFRAGAGPLLAAYHAWREKPGYPGERALWITQVTIASGVVQFR